MARKKGRNADSEFTLASKVSLRSLKLPEAWLERKIRENPSILGLDGISKISFQRSYKKAGRVDLVLTDEENSILYCAELMLGEVDESHIVRCVGYWLTEDRKPSNKGWSTIAVLAAENIRESRFFPVIEWLSQRLPLTVLELAALKVGNYTALSSTKFFDGQDQLELSVGEDEEGERIDVDRDFWAAKLGNDVIKVADALAKAFSSLDKKLRVAYLQRFWGFRHGEKPSNFITISPKKKFVNVRARIRNTERWTQALRGLGVEVTGGTPAKSIRFRVTSDLLKKSRFNKLLRQLGGEAYAEKFPAV
jgi:hypothetical protein